MFWDRVCSLSGHIPNTPITLYVGNLNSCLGEISKVRLCIEVLHILVIIVFPLCCFISVTCYLPTTKYLLSYGIRSTYEMLLNDSLLGFQTFTNWFQLQSITYIKDM